LDREQKTDDWIFPAIGFLIACIFLFMAPVRLQCAGMKTATGKILIHGTVKRFYLHQYLHHFYTQLCRFTPIYKKANTGNMQIR